jgi:hypothetical protein
MIRRRAAFVAARRRVALPHGLVAGPQDGAGTGDRLGTRLREQGSGRFPAVLAGP